MSMKAEFEILRKANRVGRQLKRGSPRSGGQPVRPLTALEVLKSRLLEEQLATARDAELRRRLRRAAEESASLAWATPIPLLALPELLAEKAREAWHQFERQRSIQERDQPTASLAA
jgi:hypothetical protein